MTDEEKQPDQRGIIMFPVPIDGGCVAQIGVPRDLKPAEADRIYRVLLTICPNEEKCQP